jgi:DNA invertase Pin-like site-specific DNA recombinase
LLERSNVMSKLIPAVAYLRRSTERQEESLEQQRTAVQKYADEKGYRIVREYKDDGISGDSTDQRTGFLQMIEDARLGDFRAIICWDQKRFGRFDSIEAGYYCFPLKRAGVVLALVNGGVIDFNDHTSRIVANVMQEGAHQDNRGHAANVTRGMQTSLDNGSWVGSVPYAGRLEGKKHHKNLVFDDPHKVAIVRRIFRQYVHEGRSMNAIAAGLDADHIPNPHGLVHATGGRPAWRFDSVKTILENPAYAGDYRARHYVHAKYHTRGPAGMEKTDGKRRRRPPSEWVIVRDHHEALIDRETFEAAQVLLAQGKTGRSKHYEGDEHPFVLHGLLRCGKCGCPMWGMKGGKNALIRYYDCSNSRYNGKSACPGTRVRESRVLHDIADHLLREFFGTLDGEALSWRAERKELQPADLPRAFARVKALVAPPRRPAADRKRMERQAKELDATIEQARRNLAHARDPENIAVMEDEIRTMKETREELAAELRRRPPSEQDVNAEATEVLRALYWMALYFRVAAEQAGLTEEERQELYEGRPMFALSNPSATLRPFLRKIAGITCHTRIEGKGTRTRHVFEGGEIGFKPVGPVTGNLDPHLIA